MHSVRVTRAVARNSCVCGRVAVRAVVIRLALRLGVIQRSLHLFFFFNDTATTEIYPLSLHDALPILRTSPSVRFPFTRRKRAASWPGFSRSEEHTSELQSRLHLVCRLLLEKKKK